MIDWLSRLIRPAGMDAEPEKIESRPKIGVVPLVILAVLGVALVLLGSGRLNPAGSGGPEPGQSEDPYAPASGERPESDYASALERNLESVLSQIRGIGAVSVLVTLDSESRMIYATTSSDDREQVEEKDSNGGTRTTTRARLTEEPVTTRTAGGGEQLVFVGAEPPRVRGVLVVADGARSPEMKLEIAQAVSSALGIALYRVAVAEREV